MVASCGVDDGFRDSNSARAYVRAQAFALNFNYSYSREMVSAAAQVGDYYSCFWCSEKKVRNE